MLGGMSWESTQSYYRAINEGIKRNLGGLHSAQIAMVSVDFDPIEKLQHAGDWDGTAKILAQKAINIEAAGADFLMICTNTMHLVADQVCSAISIPLLHIADATAEVCVDRTYRKVGLLGTRFTMEQSFYKGRLEEQFGLEVVVPAEQDRETVHRIIYQELCLGTIKEESKCAYLEVIDKLISQGSEAIILGCTEIGLLVSQDDTDIPLLDTTAIHAQKAVEWALAD